MEDSISFCFVSGETSSLLEGSEEAQEARQRRRDKKIG